MRMTLVEKYAINLFMEVSLSNFVIITSKLKLRGVCLLGRLIYFSSNLQPIHSLGVSTLSLFLSFATSKEHWFV